MENKILGIILSIVGISGLMLSLIYMNDAITSTQFSFLFACGVLGAVIFFVGIRLVPSDIPGDHQYNKPVMTPPQKVIHHP